MEGMAAQLDVVPTILGLLGQSHGSELKGVDHSALVRAGTGRSTRETTYTSTWFRWSKRVARYEAGRMCQMDFNKQATRRQLSRAKPAAGLYAFPDGCFDLQADPNQMTPILDADVEGELRGWFDGQERNNQRWGEPNNVVVPSEIDAQLKALGYAE